MHSAREMGLRGCVRCQRETKPATAIQQRLLDRSLVSTCGQTVIVEVGFCPLRRAYVDEHGLRPSARCQFILHLFSNIRSIACRQIGAAEMTQKDEQAAAAYRSTSSRSVLPLSVRTPVRDCEQLPCNPPAGAEPPALHQVPWRTGRNRLASRHELAMTVSSDSYS